MTVKARIWLALAEYVDADGNTYYYDENGRSTWTDPQRKGSNRKMWGLEALKMNLRKSQTVRSTRLALGSNVDADGNTYYYDENGRPNSDDQRKLEEKDKCISIEMRMATWR